ncbi:MULTISPECIES: multicopper oxidase family protein [Roseibium]|mgnify:FL=1|uniref:multicopper oxidase family protein n=1 Tax=Roseibium TaxID=150830 RepID=UPI003296D0DA
MLGFNGTCPGSEIRQRQNDILRARVENGLEDGTLVHWHGIRLPNAMDGVNVLTQDVIIPNEGYEYRFPVSGSRCRNLLVSLPLPFLRTGRPRTVRPLIVEEPAPPDVDQDITAILFDIRLDDTGQFDMEFDRADFITAGRLGNLMTTFLSSEQARLGDHIRLRLINPTPDRIFEIRIDGLTGFCVAYDGMPLPELVSLGNLKLAPAQRIDIIADVTGDVILRETVPSGGEELGGIMLNGQRQIRSAPIAPLPANLVPAPGEITQTADLFMQGGAGDGAHGGFGGWAFNDVSGLPNKPLISARRDEAVQVRMVNDTAFPHGIHLHGHHFWETDQNGARTHLRDTTLVAPGETMTIVCVLDNPGAWMLHCHMLSHQADGMATWMQVS